MRRAGTRARVCVRRVTIGLVAVLLAACSSRPAADPSTPRVSYPHRTGPSLSQVDPVSKSLLFGLGTFTLFRSDDGGESWETVSQPCGGRADSVALAFLDRSTGVVSCVGEYFEMTTDGGRSWSQVGSHIGHPFPEGGVLSPVVARDGEILVALFSRRGSRFSQYIGVWTKAQPRWRYARLHSGQVPEFSVSLQIVSSTRSFAVFGEPPYCDARCFGVSPRLGVSPLYVTNDGWHTWRAAPTPCNGRRVPNLFELLDATRNQVTMSCVWGLVSGSQVQDVFDTSDGGQSWTLASTTSASHSSQVGTIPSHGGLLYYDTVASVGGTIWMQSSFAGLLESQDGGHRWTRVLTALHGHRLQSQWIVMRPSGQGALMNARLGGFGWVTTWWTTRNDGRSWTMRWRSPATP